MPVTFPAHQGLIVPAKLKWPNAIDGTALCISAAAPDTAYALGPWLNTQSHTAVGVLVWALPFTLVVTSLVRWRAASGIFAALPDLGRLQLRSYRVLGTRRPSAFVTASSALLGAGSHVFIDGFTHTGRFGSNWLGMNEVLFTAPVRGDMSSARVLQYVGHFGGSIAFVAALVIVASSGRLGAWYGKEAVAEARAANASVAQRAVFWVVVVASTVGAVGFALTTGRSAIFLPLTLLVLVSVASGVVLGHQLQASDTTTTGRPGPDGRSSA